MKWICVVLGLVMLAGCNEHPVVPFDSQVSGERRDAVVHERAKVDVLWVVDNSGSMFEEQARLRENFELFIDEMAAVDADFHLAVTTTDMTPDNFPNQRVLSPQRGRFQNTPDGRPKTDEETGGVDTSACDSEPLPTVIRSRDYRREDGALDTDRLKLHFGCNATVGLRGSGFEQGLEAAVTALSHELLQTANRGFLRDDAHLAIIFVTDENDCSDRGALERDRGYECEWDADLLVPVETYAAALRALKPGGQKIVVAGIFAPDTGDRVQRPTEPSPTCDASTGLAYSGWRYEALVKEMGGVTASICQPLFTRALSQVAVAVGEALRETCLSDAPGCQLDEDCVRVELHRPAGSEDLPGARCSDAASGQARVCILNAGEHYSIDYGATCGVAITMAVDTEEGDRVVARYPQ